MDKQSNIQGTGENDQSSGGIKRSFEVYFSNFSTLVNDEGTRAFLALEVGSGHSLLGWALARVVGATPWCAPRGRALFSQKHPNSGFWMVKIADTQNKLVAGTNWDPTEL
ncbi:uncharacterized protein PGTG_17631 [Puccinia graminis f. sp. tritici CRL 75-36-700-3]|uniref:Uncharacterized protein n=1 Tax=Puccinia graminis f. sp. tritici (strain CRL 75-36-700-3 / race SCCL) TaxID=418459 RepID=E3L4V2_PUCGT|nr:uncharacterized protein PGTG_17631 [Puccinia graminis f. sp. tritici CRL 75-36-700-3]EFP91577.1 hypothetical protein PGTG_17631 [Puccinia graminis f. sp. tritici CRL 75-36-700-3]